VSYVTLRYLSQLGATQQHRTSFPTSSKHENSTPKSEFHRSCAIQTKFHPQHQVSDYYPNSLHYFG